MKRAAAIRLPVDVRHIAAIVDYAWRLTTLE